MPRSAKPRKPHAKHKTNKRNRSLTRRPHPFHALRTFDPLYRLFDALRTGEIETADGKPIMQAWGDREKYEIAPALDGWASCWQRISDGEGLALDLAPIRQMVRYLQNGVLLTPELVDKAEALTHKCQAIYQQMPRGKAISYSTTELIACEFEKIGAIS